MLAAILLLALFFKSIYLVLYIDGSPFYHAPAADSEVYVIQALELAEEGLLGDEVFYRAPLYPYFLYVFFVVSGFEPLPLHIVQLLLGLGILVLLYSIGRRIASERAGLIAAFVGLAYAPMTFYETKILATVLGMFLGLLFVHFLVRAEQEGERRDWILGAFALGMAILCRPHYLLVLPIGLVAWLYRYRGNWKPLIGPLLTLSAIVAGLIAVVTFRNFWVSGDFVPISANSGVTFAQGNAPGARGILTPIPGLSNNVLRQHINAERLAESLVGRELSPSEVNGYWFNRGIEFILDDPTQYLVLLLRKAALIVNNRELASNYLVDIDLEMFPWLKLAFLPFGIVLAWAVAGAIALARDKRAPIIVYAVLLGTVGTMLVFYVTTRYRMNLAPVAILLAGVGVDHFLRNWSDRKRTLRSACIVLAVSVLSLPAFMPIDDAYLTRVTAASWANLAVGFQLAGRAPEAARAIDTATRMVPNDASFEMQRYDFLLRPTFRSATQEFGEAQKLIQTFPRHPGGYYRTAQALMRLGRPQDAVGHYEIAVELEPGNVHALFGLAEAYDRVGRREDAEQILRRLFDIAPDHQLARELLMRIRRSGP
jgi:tetratricopeptide (TPR) repeat protein